MDAITQIFTTFGVTWPKFIAQVILFLIVYGILSKFAFGPIIKMLEERRRRIEEGQMNAEKIKQQLAEAELRYQEILHKANGEAQGIIDEARACGDALTQRQTQEAIRAAEDILAKARTEITQERTRMVSDVKKQMIGLVVDTTSKVTGKILTADDQKRLSEETASQLA